MHTAQAIADYLDIASSSMTVSEAKANFSSVVENLESGGPVMVNLYSKPKAVIIDVYEYQQVLEMAEAFEMLRISAAAEVGPKLTVDEFEARIEARRAARVAPNKAE